MDVPTLEDCCFSYILFNLELFPVDYLALLPTRMREKLLFQLPVADICRLEETAVVEGVDMNLVWKERSQASVLRYVTMSTRGELRRNEGYKQCCNEYVFGMILGGNIDDAKAMLCHMPIRRRGCAVYVGSGRSYPQSVCPPRYSSCDNQETLLAMAIQSFDPQTRLCIHYVWIPLLLRDPTFVSSIEELGCPDFVHLSTSWTSLESLYLTDLRKLRNSDVDIMKSLLPQLKSLCIDVRMWPLSNFRKMINMFLSTPSLKKQELRFFYQAEHSTTHTWSFSISNKVVISEEDWEVPEWAYDPGVAVEDQVHRSFLNEYPFTLVSRKRKYEDIANHCIFRD